MSDFRTRTRLATAVGLVSAALATGLLPGCSSDDSERAEAHARAIEAHEQLSDFVAARYEELLEANDPASARALLLGDLDTTSGILDARLEDDSTTLSWTVENGYAHVFITRTWVDISNAPAFLEAPNEISPPAPAAVQTYPHNKQALLLSPFSWQVIRDVGADYTAFVNNELALHGYTTRYIANDIELAPSISIADYTKWNDYGVINLTTHGGVLDGMVVFATGWRLQDVPADSPYQQDLDAHRLIAGTIYPLSGEWITITPRWIDKVYPGGLTGTFLHIAGCSILRDLTLSSELVGDESILFAWDNTITARAFSATGTDLFTQLLQNQLPCLQAHQQVVQHGNGDYYGVDDNGQSFHSGFRYEYEGAAHEMTLVPLEVVATIPVDGATNVSVSTHLAAAFSREVDPTTVSSATFKVSHGVTGMVAYEEQAAAFLPFAHLDWDTEYTATITTGVTDLYGDPLEADYSWTFRTMAEPDNEICITIAQGDWSFCVQNNDIYQGYCMLGFAAEPITQTGCYLSYAADAMFAGHLEGRSWSGTNNFERFEFWGTFYGEPADSFDGTIRLLDYDVQRPLIGNYEGSTINQYTGRPDEPGPARDGWRTISDSIHDSP